MPLVEEKAQPLCVVLAPVDGSFSLLRYTYLSMGYLERVYPI